MRVLLPPTYIKRQQIRKNEIDPASCQTFEIATEDRAVERLFVETCDLKVPYQRVHEKERSNEGHQR